MDKIAVVIPCYKVKSFILEVIADVPEIVDKIFVVDDACPEQSGKFVEENCKDQRVSVLYNKENLGVGGAVIHGYKQAIEQDFNIVVKIDGDGQMEGKLISKFITPIINKEADYTKGNRFYNPCFLRKMPRVRLIGNAILSFASKLSSGYWDIFDPTNGFTAISVNALKQLPLDKIANRYFFESDMLFRLNILRAVVMDIPMQAKYGDEISNFKISENIIPFAQGNLKNLAKRIFYNYYLRNFSLASIELVLGILLMAFGTIYGISHWSSTTTATAGTVMVAALPIIVGFQSLLSFINYDVNSLPKNAIGKYV